AKATLGLTATDESNAVHSGWFDELGLGGGEFKHPPEYLGGFNVSISNVHGAHCHGRTRQIGFRGKSIESFDGNIHHILVSSLDAYSSHCKLASLRTELLVSVGKGLLE